MPLTSPLLKTKFFPPPVISDFITRKDLAKKLDQILSAPLILVSAPTGYGKSSFISQSLQKDNRNFAWLSLNEQENDFQRFIIYFSYAIHKKNSSIGEEILQLGTALEMPSIGELANYFVHHLSELNKPFFLVLDDYHVIRNKEIHQFIKKLLEYPPSNFKLILVTRRDPSLPLSEWRSKNKIGEIRAEDLRFSRKETEDFFKESILQEVSNEAIAAIERITEGWISGIRLLLMVLKNKTDINNELLTEDYKDSHIFQRLLMDVLDEIPEVYRNYLLQLSVVQEFNQSLFAHLCLDNENDKDTDEIFSKFILEITNSNLFVIALDDKHHWYRFHHLIGDLLQNHAHEKLGETGIIGLKTTVAKWYLAVDDKELGLKYFLEANQYTKSVKLFSELKNTLLSQSNWQKLENIYNWFPANSVHCYSALLFAKAWISIYKGNIPEMIELIPSIEELIEKEQHPIVEKNSLLGEIHMLKAWDKYNFNMDMEACLYHSNQAIELIKEENSYAFGMAWIFYGGSMQTINRSEEAKQQLHHQLAKNIPGHLKGNIYLILCYMDWLDGNLNSLVKTASQMHMLGIGLNNWEVIANGKYFTGIAYYFLNETDKAQKELETAVKYRHFTILAHGFFALAALAYTGNELGNTKRCKQLVSEMEKLAYEKGGHHYVQFANSIASELEWKQKKSQDALRWASETSFTPFIPMSNFCSSQLAQLKILATDTKPSSWQIANEYIDSTISFLRQTNNTNFLIRTLVVKAIFQYKLNLNTESFLSLKEALLLASKRDFIQPFIKLKNELNVLFSEFNGEINALQLPEDFLNTISLFEDLSGDVVTNREIEILQNLAENLSNKELGNRLFISESTVKRHIANIFKKLDAKNRRQAIAKARELNIV